MNVTPKSILAIQLAKIKQNTKRVLNSAQPTFLHDLRGDVLRLEAALRVFSSFISIKQRLLDQLKEFRDRLGEVRDYDIVLHKLKGPGIKRAIQLRHRKARRRMLDLLRSPSHLAFFKDLKAVGFYGEKVKKPFIDKELHKSFKAILKCEKKMSSPADFHKIRRRFKDLRYRSEFFKSACEDGLKDALKVIIKFQDLLGERQDAETAVNLVSRFKSAENPQRWRRLVREQKGIIQDQQKKFRRLWKGRIKRLSCALAE